MKNPSHLSFACSFLFCAMVSCAAPGDEVQNVQHPAKSQVAVSSFWVDADHIVRGNVVDHSGAPIAAKVALVDEGGSTSSSVSAGKFELGVYGDFPQTLCAWTQDGRINWRVLESPPNGGDVTISVVDQGAFLTMVPGERHDRVSILCDGVPLHDVKFPAGEARTFVVPASLISFGTKGTKEHAADRRTARMAPGSTVVARF